MSPPPLDRKLFPTIAEVVTKVLTRRVLPRATSLLVSTSLVTVAFPATFQPRHTILPLLRLHYFEQSRLAGSLDPAQISIGIDADVVSLVQANLVRLMPDGKVAPDLATWTISQDHLTYTFTIRANARFSNGHAVTAEDAAFSLQRSLAPSTRSPVALIYLGLIRGAVAYNAGKAKTLSGVKVVGGRMLRITITKPVAYFLESLAYPTGDVLDPSVMASKTASSNAYYLTRTCTGNQGAGPFQFACRNTRSDMSSFSLPRRTPAYTLVPNPYYYGHQPHLTLQLPAYGNAYKAYLAGKLETSRIPLPFVERWRGKNSQYHSFPRSWVDYITPNVDMAPFNNLHCRLAVAYAIDRRVIANNIQSGTGQAAYDVVPRGMLGYYSGRDNPHFNLARARNELARCPDRTTPFKLAYPAQTFGFYYDNTYRAIAGMLKVVGLNVTLQRITFDRWASAVGGGPLDKSKIMIIHNAWQQDYPDPQDYCTILLRSNSPENVGSWRNAAYDRLVDRADTEPNRVRRVRLYVQAQHIALSQGAWISLINHRGEVLIKPYVHGLIGTEANADLVPRDNDWANVSIGPH